MEKGKKIVWRLIIIAILALGAVLISRPLSSLIEISKEINELSQEKAKYEESIRRDSTLINNLQDDAFLERYARENYFMQSPDEDVFIIQ